MFPLLAVSDGTEACHRIETACLPFGSRLFQSSSDYARAARREFGLAAEATIPTHRHLDTFRGKRYFVEDEFFEAEERLKTFQFHGATVQKADNVFFRLNHCNAQHCVAYYRHFIPPSRGWTSFFCGKGGRISKIIEKEKIKKGPFNGAMQKGAGDGAVFRAVPGLDTPVDQNEKT